MLARAPLLPLRDPWFNVREVVKECTALEAHLAEEDRRCPECIGKHLLAAEKLCDEALELAPADPAIRALVEPAGRTLRAVWEDVVIQEGDCTAACAQVRTMRKALQMACVEEARAKRRLAIS